MMHSRISRIIFFLCFALLIYGAGCSSGNNTGGNNAAPALVSIAVTPADPGIMLGKTQQFAATGTYSDGSTKDLTSSATWTTSNTAVAAIDRAGLASTISAGTITVSAASAGVSGVTALTVSPTPVFIQIQLHIDPFHGSDPDSRYDNERDNIPLFLTALEKHGAKASVLPTHSFAQRAHDNQDAILSEVESRGHEVGTHAHLVVANPNSKWKWSAIPSPELGASVNLATWLAEDGYYISIAALKDILSGLTSTNTHITGWSTDDDQRTKLFDLTERLGYLTSAGGYPGLTSYDYHHYAYHPASGPTYTVEAPEGSVRQLYFHHMGPAIEQDRLGAIENCGPGSGTDTIICDFLATLDQAATTPGKVFVHGWAIHNNTLFNPNPDGTASVNAANYDRIEKILTFYDAYVKQGKAVYSTFRDVYGVHSQ